MVNLPKRVGEGLEADISAIIQSVRRQEFSE